MIFRKLNVPENGAKNVLTEFFIKFISHRLHFSIEKNENLVDMPHYTTTLGSTWNQYFIVNSLWIGAPFGYPYTFDNYPTLLFASITISDIRLKIADGLENGTKRCDTFI